MSTGLLAASSGFGTGWCTLGLIQKVAMAIHRHWLAWKWGFLGAMALVFIGIFSDGCSKEVAWQLLLCLC